MARRALRGAAAGRSLVAALATIAWPVAGRRPPRLPAPVPAQAPGDLCSTEEWQADFRGCVDKLPDVGATRAQCLKAPTPSTPDSGLAGWFAEPPDVVEARTAPQGIYSHYGYAGYSYTTYDIEAARPR